MKKFFAFLFLSALVGCAMFKDKYDHDKVAKVHRVAILSFEVVQDQPTDNVGISSLTGSRSMMKRTGEMPEMKEMAKKVYSDLQAHLSQGLGKTFVSADKIASTPAYKDIYQQKMTGLKSQTIVGNAKAEHIWVDGILDQVNFRKLTYAEKVKLAKSVGADAFIEYLAIQTIDQPTFSIGHLSGNASFQFTTRSNLMMYSIDSEEPIWQNQNLDGKESRSSKELEGQTVVQKLSTIGFESAQSSIRRFNESLSSYKR